MVVNTETHNWTNFKESQQSIELHMEPRYHIPKAEGPMQQRGLVEKFVRARGRGGQEWNSVFWTWTDCDTRNSPYSGHLHKTCTRSMQTTFKHEVGTSLHPKLRTYRHLTASEWGGVSFLWVWLLKGWSIPSDGTTFRRLWAAQIGVHELLKTYQETNKQQLGLESWQAIKSTCGSWRRSWFGSQHIHGK